MQPGGHVCPTEVEADRLDMEQRSELGIVVFDFNDERLGFFAVDEELDRPRWSVH
jgi:hypothetical protein